VENLPRLLANASNVDAMGATGLIPAKDTNPASRMLTMAGVVIVIVGLYFGRRVLIPLALSIVLSFLATPLVTLLERLRLGRVFSVIVVLALFFALLGTVAWGVTNQLVQVIALLPDYRENIHQKIEAVSAPGDGGLSRAAAAVSDLTKEINSASQSAQNQKLSKRDPKEPISVQLATPPRSANEYLRDIIGPATGVLETAGIVVIFTLFVLIKREDLRNRLVRLAGVDQLQLVTQAMDDASKRLSRYLLLQFAVNGVYGGLFGLALFFIGIPHPLLWGVCAFLLRFIPYLGTPVSALFPMVLAFAIFPGWTQIAETFGAFLLLEISTANLIEPWLYGAHTGVSSLAILVAAIFWGALWGPVGLILSTPLTMCLMLLGRYVPQLSFLDVLLGDEPVLAVKEHLYQRLLAFDLEEAREISWRYLKENPLIDFYDQVLLPVLTLAEQDRRRNALDESRTRFIHESARELVEEASDMSLANSTEPAESCTSEQEKTATPATVVCLPARNEADELSAMMMAQVLERDGHSAQVLPRNQMGNIFEELEKQHPDVICISALHPLAPGQTRPLCKQLRQRWPEVKLIIGLWEYPGGAIKAQQRIGSSCANFIGTSLAEVVAAIGKPQSEAAINDASNLQSVEAVSR
jgi:predicted PurR-regulated permease PerM